MFDKLKELFMKNVGGAVASNKSEEDDNTVISNKFNYEYDYDNQKEIKQIYPNNDGIEVILGFRENRNVEDGHRVSHEYVRRQIPIEKHVYILDDTFKFDQLYNEGFQRGTLHGLLKVVSIQHDNQRREILNRWLREHDDALWKHSPTKYDEYGDNLHSGLLVVERDPNSDVPDDIASRCWYIGISRIAIVETPWTQEVVMKNGDVRIDRGVDRRLHVYTIPLDVDWGKRKLERELEVERVNRKLGDFLS
jgi:hypothetical protein